MQNNNEKFVLEDVLYTQKQATETYNIWSGECANNKLRNEFLNILKDEHDIQNELFCEMNSRGFYQVKPATTQEIDTLKQKYC